MKKILIHIAIVLLSISVNAQNQTTTTGNLKIHTGATLTFFGDFVNNGIFDDGGHAVVFSGTNSQKISGTSTLTFTNLTINNPSGVTLEQSVIVNNSLILTTGAFDLNSHTLTINNTLTSSINRTGGYIISEKTDNSGKLTWNMGNNAGLYTFPFGTSTGEYIPFLLNLVEGNIGTVTVSTYPTAANNIPYPTVPVLVSNLNDATGNDNSANVVDRFWQVDVDGPDGNATLTFTATSPEVGTISSLTAQRWDPVSNIWETPLPGQTNTANSATVPGVTKFSVWALSGNLSPLPVELVSFIALKDNNVVKLNWETLSETNNDYFTIEKTTDGENYSVVATVDAAGNSNHYIRYSETDNEPFIGISYYRLKQTDFDGRHSYSDLRSVEFNQKNDFCANVFPNPASKENINLTVLNVKDEVIKVNIKDMLGKEVYSGTFDITENDQTITLDNTGSVSSGLCFITVMCRKESITHKLIIKT